MYRLDDVLRAGRNNFDLLRLCAALAVVVGHSYVFYPRTSGWDLLLLLTHHESTGSLAVFTFFLISGMLVSASWERDPRVLAYLSHRIMRLWPALWVNTLLLTFLVVPLWSTDLSYGQALRNPSLWHWFRHTLSLWSGTVVPVAQAFLGLPFKATPNAVVWTLPLEFKAYLLVLAMGWGLAFQQTWRFILAMTLATLALAWTYLHPPALAVLADWGRLVPGYTAPPVLFFLFGVLLYRYRTRVVIHAWPLPLALLLTYLVRDRRGGEVVLLLTWTWLILWLAAWPRLRAWIPAQDRSYGVYLYDFPVQQMLACLTPHLNHWLSLFIVLPATWALAGWSWRFVEHPALLWVRRRYPRPRLSAS